MFMLGILGTKTSPPCICSMQRMHEAHALLEVSQKRVMRAIGDGHLPAASLLLEEQRDHAAAAAHDVAVADAAEPGAGRAAVGVGLDEQLLGHSLVAP